MPFFNLNEEEIEILNRPVEGNGGFQTFFRQLQQALNEENRIYVSAADVERIRGQSRKGIGGFQDRLTGIFGNHIDGMVN